MEWVARSSGGEKKKLIQTSCILTYAIVGEYCRIKEHNVAGGITFLLLYL